MPVMEYNGTVHVVRSTREWEKALNDLAAETILGFDTETRPTFRKGTVNAPALIQLATANSVYLIQLCWLPFNSECAGLLACPDIVKAGVSIRDDMIALSRIIPFEAAGVADLGEISRQQGLPNHGLRTLAASLFGWRIAKGSQCSNWSARNLTPRQIAYAATDAWIGRMIYLRLQELGLIDV